MVSFLHLGVDTVDSDQSSANTELLFLQLVSMLQMAAMQQMGKIMDPVTNEVHRDLDQAKVSIDLIDMLKAKTEGNLGEREKEFLDKIVFELHMNYVDEVRAAEQAAASEPEKDEDQSAEEEAPPNEASAEEGDKS